MLKNAAGFKTKQDDVFGRIASKYDLLCDLFSLGLHRLWKSRVASIISNESWTTFLDTASGTGDIALRVIKKAKIHSAQKVVISDISEKMLEIASKKFLKVFLTLRLESWMHARCLKLEVNQ